jgi:hypothetical protein
MPAEYRLDRESQIVFSRAWGKCTTEDFHAHGTRLLADADFSPDFRQLWDFSEVTESMSDFDTLARLAQTNVFSPTARRAIVAPTDAVFGVGRMFQMLREAKGETGIRVFRDRETAVRWLETGAEPAVEPRVGSANPLRHSAPRR